MQREQLQELLITKENIKNFTIKDSRTYKINKKGRVEIKKSYLIFGIGILGSLTLTEEEFIKAMQKMHSFESENSGGTDE